MRTLLKPFYWLYCIYAMLLFVVLMVPVFIWSLLVMPFGKIKGGNLIYRGCMLWADIWFALVFIRHKNIFEQKLKKHQSYIFVANHISYLDSAIIVKTFRKPLRPLGKIEMSKVPVFGFIYKNTIVTVDRSSAAHRARSVHILKGILKKEISILVFPEGTFNTTHKPVKHFYDGAFKIAIETGTPIKPVLLLDSYDRLHYRSVFSLNPGRNRSVFLEEIPTKGLSTNDVHLLKEKVQTLMEEKLRHYRASWIKE
jgi:1-acyl-sn-glycerol-3-phosphate acyltransferase